MTDDENKWATQIFISYASEDNLIATAFERAINSLSIDGNYPLKVILDIHSLELGRSLSGQIHEHLDATDILFIIYTEQLKLSHSFTGMELGSFGRIIYEEKRKLGHSDRRSVRVHFESADQRASLRSRMMLEAA